MWQPQTDGSCAGRDLSDHLDEVSGTERAAALQLAGAGLQGGRVGHNQHVVSYRGRKQGEDPGSNNEAQLLPDAAAPPAPPAPPSPPRLQSDRMSRVTWKLRLM